MKYKRIVIDRKDGFGDAGTGQADGSRGVWNGLQTQARSGRQPGRDADRLSQRGFPRAHPQSDRGWRGPGRGSHWGAHLKRSFQTLRTGGLLVSTASTAPVWGKAGVPEVLLGLLRLPVWNALPNSKSTLLFDVVALNDKNPTWYADDLEVLMGYLAERKIAPVIARRMPLTQARQAQELLLGAKVKGKIVLLCEESMQSSETASPVS